MEISTGPEVVCIFPHCQFRFEKPRKWWGFRRHGEMVGRLAVLQGTFELDSRAQPISFVEGGPEAVTKMMVIRRRRRTVAIRLLVY